MPHVVRPSDGLFVALGGLGARLLTDAGRTGGDFALVEHALAPRTLATPLHAHSREDEYVYVLHGRVGVQVGDDVADAGPGDFVSMPRGIPHAFWNATDEPARLLTIVSPGGFERYYAEAKSLFRPEGPDYPAVASLASRYGVEVDFTSGPVLAEQYHLALGPQGEPAG